VHEARSKQQGRRFPPSIFEMLTSTRRCRVCGLRVACTQRTQRITAMSAASTPGQDKTRITDALLDTLAYAA
jgi:hypothetical protein